MPHLLYITAPDAEKAKKISRTLVEEKLIACANILPGATSIYRWEGKLEEASEAIIIAKTGKDKLERAKKRILELHPYDVPCVVAIEIATGNPDFLKWVEESVSS